MLKLTLNEIYIYVTGNVYDSLVNLFTSKFIEVS